MWCMKCNHDLSECTCPDLMERLESVSGSAPFVFERCAKCGLHHAACKCEQPDREIVGAEHLSAPAKDLSEDRADKKLRSIVFDLMRICGGIHEGMSQTTRDRLNNTMAEFLKSQCNEAGRVSPIELLYMLSNGLIFILAQVIDGVPAKSARA